MTPYVSESKTPSTMIATPKTNMPVGMTARKLNRTAAQVPTSDMTITTTTSGASASADFSGE